jgi:hypothetical protein
MRTVSQKIAECLYGDDSAMNCILFRHGFLEKDLQRLPAIAAQIREEISAEDFGYAEHEMPVRNGLEDFFTETLSELNYPFLMTRWTEMPSLA